MGNIQLETDHAAKMLARLAEEFRKPRTQAVLSAHGVQYQALEQAFYDLYSKFGIETGVGFVLDVLGKIVGETRQGTSDADYRPRLRARIRANQSDGTIEDLIAIINLVLGPILAPLATIKVTEYFPAAFKLDVLTLPLTASLITFCHWFLRDSRGAGIWYNFGYQTTADTDTFVCATSTPLKIATLAGVTSFTVWDTTDFSSSGTIVIDEGLATEETLAYASKTGTTLDGFAATANAHSIGAMITLSGTVGKGWGDDAVPVTGGSLAGVL